MFPEIKVGMREIMLQNGESVFVYDTTGAYTDPEHKINTKKGMPKVRNNWKKEEKDEFAEICGAVQRCDDPDLDRGGSDLFCDRLYRRKAGGVF